MGSENRGTVIFVREWINSLEVSSYENDTLLQCLSETKVQSKASKNDQQQVLSLIERIIINSQLDWISSPYSEVLILDCLADINPVALLLSLTSLQYELSVGCRLELVVSLLEQFLRSGCYMKLLLQESKVSLPMSQPLWEKLISCISSLPEHVANKFKSIKSFDFFHHEKFFIFIGVQIAEAIECLTEDIKQGCAINTQFLAQNIGLFCLRGKTESIFKSLLPIMTAKTKHSFLWQRVCHKCFLKIPDRCFSCVLHHLFDKAPTRSCLTRILGELVIENEGAKYIIMQKLLLKHFSKRSSVVVNIIAYIASISSTDLVTEVLKRLLSVWSSSSSIKHTSYDQHHYVTSAILVCTCYISENLDQRHKQELISSLMTGMKNHLESPDAKIRTLGMIVGEKLTAVVSLNTEKDTKLQFDLPTTEETKYLLSLCEPVSEPSDTFYEKQLETYNKIKEEIRTSEAGTIQTEVAFSAPKGRFLKMAESQQINLSSRDGSKEPLAEADEADSDDDLVPYDIPEEKPFSKVPRPLYIRDCLEGLIENKDREHMEIYLNAVADLVSADAFAAKEVCVELCKILLNLQDNYSIDDFNRVRNSAVVSLLACDPENVAKYITDEFYSEHYNIRQRMDMLDILVLAAGKLSSVKRNKQKSAENFITELESAPNGSLSWRQVVDRRIETKTRRFGKARKPLESRPDQFGPVAGYFFYPLMAGYDRRIRTMDILGTDSIVLGRLLYALGTILYATANATVAEQMTKSLLEFVAALRGHAESFVRKACVYCVTMATLSAPALTDRLGDVSLDARQWLCDVLEHDDDMEARELALSALALMNSKVRQELKTEIT